MNSSLLGTGPKSTEHVEKHRMPANIEYPEHPTATPVHSCASAETTTPRKCISSKDILAFFFLLVGLRFISSRVNCACQHCKFYPLPLSTNTSFLSSFTALQTCGCSMVRKFILLQQVVKGLHKESWANTTFFTAMFKMAITSYCFCSSFCVGLER